MAVMTSDVKPTLSLLKPRVNIGNNKSRTFIKHVLRLIMAVLTNGHTGHVPRASDFFLFEGPPTGCGEILFKKTNYLITFAKINCKGNPVNTF